MSPATIFNQPGSGSETTLLILASLCFSNILTRKTRFQAYFASKRRGCPMFGQTHIPRTESRTVVFTPKQLVYSWCRSSSHGSIGFDLFQYATWNGHKRRPSLRGPRSRRWGITVSQSLRLFGTPQQALPGKFIGLPEVFLWMILLLPLLQDHLKTGVGCIDREASPQFTWILGQLGRHLQPAS